VTDDPCGVAAQVAAVLAAQGWTGTLHPCGPTCRAALSLPNPGPNPGR